MGWATACVNFRVHFVHHHMRDTILILEEGLRPHTRFPTCDMFVPWVGLNLHHPTTYLCAWGADRKRRWLGGGGGTGESTNRL